MCRLKVSAGDAGTSQHMQRYMAGEIDAEEYVALTQKEAADFVRRSRRLQEEWVTTEEKDDEALS